MCRPTHGVNQLKSFVLADRARVFPNLPSAPVSTNAPMSSAAPALGDPSTDRYAMIVTMAETIVKY
jgi:hypothetical protein